MSEPLPQVKLTTSKGEMVLELFEDQTPNTVANFVSLTESGFYDGVLFHRVLPNFVVQGGDPLTKEAGEKHRWGTGGPGYCIDCETDDSPKHGAKFLSMAHAGLNSGGSQFFITHSPQPHLDGKHTVFGRVVTGEDVVDAIRQGDVIEKAEVLSKRDHDYLPVKNKGRR